MVWNGSTKGKVVVIANPVTKKAPQFLVRLQ